MSHQLFDPGLQPERTELAWRRTTLALIVGALVALRLLPPALGSWSIIVGLAGLVLAAIIWVLADRRARLTSHVLRHEHAVLPGGASSFSSPPSPRLELPSDWCTSHSTERTGLVLTSCVSNHSSLTRSPAIHRGSQALGA